MNVPQKNLKLVLMGLSFNTGNLGVAALTEGAVQGFLDCAPEAKITVVSGARETRDATVNHRGREIAITVLPIRYGKRLFEANHVAILYVAALLMRCLPFRIIRARLLSRSPVLRALAGADFVADVSGGDSFTDIYGPLRMTLQTLFKGLVLLVGRDLVLLPQTIGPFRRRVSRMAARFILRRAKAIYTRDLEGIEETLVIAGQSVKDRLRFAPDVGFLVEAAEPRDSKFAGRVKAISRDKTLVGVNVSGLLFSGGYTRANQFGFRADYAALMVDFLRRFLADPAVFVLLVPHVVAGRGSVEDDVTACEKVLGALEPALVERTLVVSGDLSVREVKWVIGRCAFFVGARMHSCIAALSQGVPAVGIAYSRKFRGVFETLGLGRLVVDPRTEDADVILETVMREFDLRDKSRVELAHAVPEVAAKTRAVFEDICGAAR